LSNFTSSRLFIFQPGHLARDCWYHDQGNEQGTSAQGNLSISSINNLNNVMTVTVAVVRSQATIVKRELSGKAVDVMLNSGSSVSLVQ